VWAGKGIPHGNGQKVLLLPGLMAGDASLSMMRDWLERIGYRVMLSHIGFNVGCPSATMRRLAEEVEDDGARVSVIGHSKGGLVALILAQAHPELVNQVMTMGSPLADPFDVRGLTKVALHGIGSWRRAHREEGCCDHCYTPACTCEGIAEMRGRLRRPVTSFYSRRDGVVNWQACLRPGATGMQVDASHVGMACNPAVYSGLAHLLAQDVS
jgi:pimeloyl-ACP methyl ester carboxylesterase